MFSAKSVINIHFLQPTIVEGNGIELEVAMFEEGAPNKIVCFTPER
jgi:hypothetical protein